MKGEDEIMDRWINESIDGECTKKKVDRWMDESIDR